MPSTTSVPSQCSHLCLFLLRCPNPPAHGLAHFCITLPRPLLLLTFTTPGLLFVSRHSRRQHACVILTDTLPSAICLEMTGHSTPGAHRAPPPQSDTGHLPPTPTPPVLGNEHLARDGVDCKKRNLIGARMVCVVHPDYFLDQLVCDCVCVLENRLRVSGDRSTQCPSWWSITISSSSAGLYFLSSSSPSALSSSIPH